MRTTHTLYILFILCISFFSCTKESGQTVSRPSVYSSPVTPPGSNPLSGMEFEFRDLDWTYWNSGFPEWDELYVATPSRQDLFTNTPGLHFNDFLNADVSIQTDSSSGFIPVRPSREAGPSVQFPFCYVVIEPNLLVNTSPARRQELMGRKATVRIRFR